VAVKRASQSGGVVPLLTCKEYIQTIVRLPVGIPAGITGIRAFEDEPAFNSTLPLTGKLYITNTAEAAQNARRTRNATTRRLLE
jgi:hypothetical protein